MDSRANMIRWTSNETGTTLWLPPGVSTGMGLATMLRGALVTLRHGGLTGLRRGLGGGRLRHPAGIVSRR